MKSTPTFETRNYTLKDQIALRIKCEVKDCLSREVRCNDMNCGGVGSIKSFSMLNVLLPLCLILEIQVYSESQRSRYNNFPPSTKAEEFIAINNVTYQLCGSIICQNQHFLAVNKFGSNFYNQDNLDVTLSKKAFSTFKSAFLGKHSSETELLALDRESTIKHGGVGFLVYSRDDLLQKNVGEYFEKFSVNAKVHIVKDDCFVLDDASLGKDPIHIDIDDCICVDDQYSIGEKSSSTNLVVLKPNPLEKDLEEAMNIDDIGSYENRNKNHGIYEESPMEGSIGKCSIREKVSDIDIEEEERLSSIEKDCPREGSIGKDKYIEDSDMDFQDTDNITDEIASNYEDDFSDTGEEGNFCYDSYELPSSKKEDRMDDTMHDYRLQSWQDIGRYMENYKGAFIDHSSGQWFCFICKNMAPGSTRNRAWVDVGVSLGHLPGQRFRKHFSSDFHASCVEKRQMLDLASANFKEGNVLKLLKEMSTTTKQKEALHNLLFVKTCFRVVHHIVMNIFPNYSFGSLVELISNCGSDIVKNHLLTCARNATYTSKFMFNKYLEVLNKYIEDPILHSLQSTDFFTLYHDETTDVEKHSQVAVFIMFEHQGQIAEHFIGLVNMTSMCSLTAEMLFKGTEDLARSKSIALNKCAFSETDRCSTNEGNKKGLKKHFEALNPFHIHEGCNSHGLALIPKHLITNTEKYSCVKNADRLMVNLGIFFKDSALRMGVLENVQSALNLKVFKLICPSSTRWLSHGRCFSRVVERYAQIAISLATIWDDRGDATAFGMLQLMLKPEMILTCLALSDLLRIMNILVLWLQKSPSSMDVTDLQSVVQLVVSKIRALTSSSEVKSDVFSTRDIEEIVFTEKNFLRISQDVRAISINKIPMINRRSNISDVETFNTFKQSVHDPFLNDIANEIQLKIKPSPISAAFKCLDLKLLPHDSSKLTEHGLIELEDLVNHFGHGRSSTHPLSGKQCSADAQIDRVSTYPEYETYKRLAFGFREKKNTEIYEKIEGLNRKIAQTLRTNSNEKKIADMNAEKIELSNSINEISLRDVFLHFQHSESTPAIIPNIMVLLKLAILCPLGNAVVERLFSLMSMTKTESRNLLSDTTLDRLLRVKKEGPNSLSEDDLSRLSDMLRDLLCSENKSSTTRLKF